MSRRQARENVLQMLYMIDNCHMKYGEVLESFKDCLSEEENYKEFTFALLKGVEENKIFIDELICKYAKNWEMGRMAVIDRNILRLASFEIVYMPQTPINVIIDEAVEISKTFSTEDSSKFVNGILDKLQSERGKLRGLDE